jgi:hypothetical protein
VAGKTLFFIMAALTTALGWYQLFRFSATPGEQLAAPARLPVNRFTQSSSPLLLVFVHPECSCTHATLGQLDRILHLQGRVNPVHVVLAVYQSRKLDRSSGRVTFNPEIWLHTPFSLLVDTDGALAHRFGAATSGEIVLYAADGRLLFQGGITSERAQVGDSVTANALSNALLKGTLQAGRASVFGCPIFRLQRAG